MMASRASNRDHNQRRRASTQSASCGTAVVVVMNTTIRLSPPLKERAHENTMQPTAGLIDPVIFHRNVTARWTVLPSLRAGHALLVLCLLVLEIGRASCRERVCQYV